MAKYKSKSTKRKPQTHSSKNTRGTKTWLGIFTSLFSLLVFIHESGYLDPVEQKLTSLRLPQNPKSHFQLAKNYLKDSIGNDFGLPAYNKEDLIIRHSFYTLSYDEKNEQAKWVAYLLKADYVVGTAERKDDFRPDAAVSTKSATPSDYATSGYDRGHLAPAADFKFSAKAMSESFFMSNMSPQAPDFNRGIWEKIEEKVRYWVKKDKELYIVTGPVLKDGNFKKIGKTNKVSVPEYYYKIILDIQEPDIKMVAFLLKNEGSTLPIKDFVVTVDEVEEKTGIDFFPALPDSLENALEGKKTVTKWFPK